MAWQNPKTNWAAADGVRDTDFNRIESNTLELRNQAALIGVYQTPTVSIATKSAQSFTTNPIPTTWTAVTANTEYSSGGYRIKSSSSPNAQPISNAFDSSAVNYASVLGTEAWAQVELPEALLVDSIRLRYTVPVTTTSIKIKGSNDGSTWTDIWTAPTNGSISTATVINITDPGVYKYYRLVVTMSSSGTFDLYMFQFADYTVTTYTANFTVAAMTGMSELANGHKVLLFVSSNYSNVGVVENNLNGKPVSTILVPGRKYELMYTGTRYTATEVA